MPDSIETWENMTPELMQQNIEAIQRAYEQVTGKSVNADSENLGKKQWSKTREGAEGHDLEKNVLFREWDTECRPVDRREHEG